MKPSFPSVIGLACTLVMSGCTTLPSFNKSSASSPDPASIEPIPTAIDVINHVQCRLYDLLSDSDPALKKLGDRFVVYGNLTLEVTEDGSLNPSLSFIHPVSVADMTSKMLGITGKYDAGAHRTYQHEFTLLLDKSGDAAKKYKEQCAGPPPTGTALSGDLGIRSVVAQGLKKIHKEDFVFPLVASDDNILASMSWPALPTFGSTIDFSLTYGLGLNPKWTLVHFQGPGADDPLLNVSRTTKDTLIIAFAPSMKPSNQANLGALARPAPGLTPEQNAAVARTFQDALAARAAQDAATRMLLLRQFPFR